MRRLAGTTLLFLGAAAVVCAMAFVGDPRAKQIGSSPARSDRLAPYGSGSETAAGASAAHAERDPAARGGEALDSRTDFRGWFERQVATGKDLHELRRDLAWAMERLPAGELSGAGHEDSRAFEELTRAELRPAADFRALRDEADRFMDRFPNSVHVTEVRARLTKYAELSDEHDIQTARQFSLEQPENFAGRVARFQEYLKDHAAGRSAAEARAAIQTIRQEWAEHDYRTAYAFAQQYPNDVRSIAARLNRYVADHPAGRHLDAAHQFLERYERAAAPGDYAVRVRSASIARSAARWLSRGPDLAMEIEVGGVWIGRTPIVSDSFEPEWNYEFPQRVRWRVGDPVRIRLVDFDYGNRTVVLVESPADDPFAMRYLAGPISAGGHRLVFDSDFRAPTVAAP